MSHSSHHREDTSESIKETLEALVVAFIIAFVFRAYVVEAFVIPTGSMAPTLLGEHLSVSCRQCGYSFDCDINDSDRSEVAELGDGRRLTVRRNALTRPVGVACPMCQFTNVAAEKTRLSAGDRILVQKYIYQVREPRRWDVVVFKAPHQPHTSYIKRLVGLPNEHLVIIEGNVYTRRLDARGNPMSSWQVARKIDPSRGFNAFDVQRAVWQPVYHSQYIPLDSGRSRSDAKGRLQEDWQVPWEAVSGDWKIEGRRSYRLDSPQGRIAFRFDRAASKTRAPWHVYNQFKQEPSIDPEAIEDVRLAAAVEPDSTGTAVTLRTTARLDETGVPLPLLATLEADGSVSLSREDARTGHRTVLVRSPQKVAPLVPSHTRLLELWYVDQQAVFLIDGVPVATQLFDFSMQHLRSRPPLRGVQYPELAIDVTGGSAQLHRVEVDRDLYFSAQQGGRYAEGNALLVKFPSGLEGRYEQEGSPLRLATDEFYCMGDNSPLSHDSRFWSSPDPWVDETVGRPLQRGVVPRELMMGRAFFVYYPAPLKPRPDWMAFIPDFGHMRFIH